MSSIPDEVVNMVQYLLIADYQKLPFKRTGKDQALVEVRSFIVSVYT